MDEELSGIVMRYGAKGKRDKKTSLIHEQAKLKREGECRK